MRVIWEQKLFVLTAANVDVLNTSAINEDRVRLAVIDNIIVELPLSQRYITGENCTALRRPRTSAMPHDLHFPALRS